MPWLFGAVGSGQLPGILRTGSQVLLVRDTEVLGRDASLTHMEGGCMSASAGSFVQRWRARLRAMPCSLIGFGVIHKATSSSS
jgi:hypothetical protein